MAQPTSAIEFGCWQLVNDSVDPRKAYRHIFSVFKQKLSHLYLDVIDGDEWLFS